MQRLLLVLLVTTGAVSLSGCGLFNSLNEIDQSVDDSSNPTDQITQPIEAIGNALPDLPTGEDSDTVVAVSTNSPTVIASDLIQSTDPNERTISVERTRLDPFAGLTIPPTPPQPIRAPEATTTGSGNQSSSGTPVAASPNSSAQTGTSASPLPEARPSLSPPRQLESDRPEIAVLPEIPKPTTAQAVRVSGIMQIGGSPYAIVTAPNEVERYVRPGERVAGGRVLVKRIDTNAAEPRVVLVENGIEVERFVTSPDAVTTTEEAVPTPAVESVSAISSLPAPPSSGI